MKTKLDQHFLTIVLVSSRCVILESIGSKQHLTGLGITYQWQTRCCIVFWTLAEDESCLLLTDVVCWISSSVYPLLNELDLLMGCLKINHRHHCCLKYLLSFPLSFLMRCWSMQWPDDHKRPFVFPVGFSFKSQLSRNLQCTRTESICYLIFQWRALSFNSIARVAFEISSH